MTGAQVQPAMPPVAIERQQVFLSLVMVVRNQAAELHSLLSECGAKLGEWATDHEIVVVDNASVDSSGRTLEALTGASGLPNMQVILLAKEVDADTALWAGVEQSLGDYVVAFDPGCDSLDLVPRMLAKAQSGSDVVLGRNARRGPRSLAYVVLERAFDAAYLRLTGVSLTKDAPAFRLLSRRVVNYTLRHATPSVAYRYLSVAGGFPTSTVDYSASPRSPSRRSIGDAVDRGMKLLVSTTRLPMRLVAGLALFGAGANVAYSIYVILVAIFKDDVAPGWVTLSLQQAGMFFLISLVLFVLGEYLIHAVGMFTEGPPYEVSREFTSARMERMERLNVLHGGRPLQGRPARSEDA